MNKDEIENIAKYIDKVLKSKKSKLAQADRDTLVIAREGLRKAKVKKDLIGPLRMIAKILAVAKSIYDGLK